MRWLVLVVFGAAALGAVVALDYPLARAGLFDDAKDFLGDLGIDDPAGALLADEEIAEGLREALGVGAGRVVDTLGVEDGFNASTDVHIPLPRKLRKVQEMLEPLGLGRHGEKLELRLNRAAEAAMPRARALFWSAIEEMTLDDVRAIYDGPDDAATQYFRTKMSEPLAGEMKPIVDEELANVGAIRSYDRMMGEYDDIPFVPDVKSDLTNHVLKRAIDGVFLYLGREEAAIRQDPAKRTTEILQRVFGAE